MPCHALRTLEVGVEDGVDEGPRVARGAEQGRGQEAAQAAAEEGHHLPSRRGKEGKKGVGLIMVSL